MPGPASTAIIATATATATPTATATVTATAASVPTAVASSSPPTPPPSSDSNTRAGSTKTHLLSQPDKIAKAVPVDLVGVDAIPSKVRQAPNPSSAATRSSRTSSTNSTTITTANTSKTANFSATSSSTTTTTSIKAVALDSTVQNPDHRRISRRLNFLARHPGHVVEALPAATQSLRLPPLRLSRSSSSHLGLRKTAEAAFAPRHSSAEVVSTASTDKPSEVRQAGSTSTASTQGSTADPASSTRSTEASNNSDGPKSETTLDGRAAESSLTPANVDHAKSGLKALRGTGDRDRKMHQTSSRLLRMTEEERPFSRDFKDLFSTLIVSLPLTPHRVRFQRIDHTFTSDEAVTNLGSLKFSQSNRMPDPKDPSRIVTTTTTTTFSMAKEMARSVCHRFLEARLIESVDGRADFSSKSAVWQLTPKGIYILQRFCQRNGINQRHVYDLFESSRNSLHMVFLERDRDTDRLNSDVATVEVIFRRFAGHDGPNQKASASGSDSDSVHEYSTGLVGVKVAKERRVGDKVYWNTFTGKAAADWLLDCATVIDKREAFELCSLFIEHGLIQPIDASQGSRFQPTKSAIYFVTEKGQRVAGWISSPKSSANGDSASIRAREGTGRDSNANRMALICQDPALRLLFKEFLRETHCEENLAFYLDVKEFLAGYQAAKKANAAPKLEVIRETLAAAYSLYNAFLAPGSPCELNIDHSLRTALAARMTRAVGDDEAMMMSLDEIALLFDQAQNSVFKLMASDSVPKFMREAKYSPVLRERNLDAGVASYPSTSSRTSSS